MADDTSQDQTQTATEPTQQPTVPPSDQQTVDTPPSQQPTPEQQQANPVSSETPITPASPTSPTTEQQPTEASQPIQSGTPAPTDTPPKPEQVPVAPPTETSPPVSPPVINIPALHFPFSANFPVTFSFGAQSDNEEIKKKFAEWGIVGHNGLDFGLTSGTEVFPCDSGKIIQSGDNGDFGTSITIQHSWGQSLYAHLSETKVKEGEEIPVNKVIGLSGSSGAAFGEHLHFAIKPNNADLNNGYLGFIDPSPYLSLPSQKEEIKQEIPKPEEVKPPEPVIQQPESTPQQPTEPEPTISIEPEKPVEQPPVIVDQAQIQKQVDEKLKEEVDSRRQKANEVRQARREENLMKIEKLIEHKKQINNDDIRELLHVSQSAVTNYLQTLVDRGTIKKEGKGKATTYHY